MLTRWKIRPIESRDDAAVAAIIRTVMPEYGATGDGFAINDPEVDWMQRAYSLPRSAYFVVELEGKVVGGGGVAPLAGGDEDTCELRKMYFLKHIRGQGIGSEMLKRCLETARSFGFRFCYLETLSGMNDAIQLYERHGFKRIGAPRGRTGHGGCNTYYLREL
jgi:putative acetyltransferase